ncbi:SDR family oxidoreductase [Photobacterium sp. SDRW27]|uniref:SDR family oxidoreductase n=1 Tax=Photobacterium obscurum TaxID=2829490 RepID=UPI00224464B1|nr:SDR family oxidoreductase [Photobacterium obscurum]MCW8329910.1 SDR family oxidoreductase [Photobacterium obscurum]
MKELVVFGASRGLGLAIAKYYREQGHPVTAMVRDPDSATELADAGVSVIKGDGLNPEDIEHVLRQASPDSWVISTMGSFRASQPVDYIGHRHLINLLEEHKLQRFLMVTSLGCGDSWATLPERAKAAFGQAVREKSLAESWLQTSLLEYTILRPGGLQDGAVSQSGELSQGKEVHGLISRSEVARLTLKLLADDTSIRQIYECVDPEFVYKR